MTSRDYNEFITAYFECALWSSCDDVEHPLDDFYGTQDIDPESLNAQQVECLQFIGDNAGLLSGLDAGQCGHDFWLTRNGHGAGFWDRGLGEVGDKLTENCKAMGSVDIIVCDGVLYFQ